MFEMAHSQTDVLRADDLLAKFAPRLELRTGDVARNLATRIVHPTIATQLTLLL